MDFEKEQRGTVLRCKESELMIYTLNNRLMTTLTVPANEILLDNIMRVMSGEYFGVRKAAKIVGGIFFFTVVNLEVIKTYSH